MFVYHCLLLFFYFLYLFFILSLFVLLIFYYYSDQTKLLQPQHEIVEELTEDGTIFSQAAQSVVNTLPGLEVEPLAEVCLFIISIIYTLLFVNLINCSISISISIFVLFFFLQYYSYFKHCINPKAADGILLQL